MEPPVITAVRQKEEVTVETFAEWQEQYGNSKKASSTATTPTEIKGLQVWSDDENSDVDDVDELVSV